MDIKSSLLKKITVHFILTEKETILRELWLTRYWWGNFGKRAPPTPPNKNSRSSMAARAPAGRAPRAGKAGAPGRQRLNPGGIQRPAVPPDKGRPTHGDPHPGPPPRSLKPFSPARIPLKSPAGTPGGGHGWRALGPKEPQDRPFWGIIWGLPVLESSLEGE
jgi:hypothetical protein